MVSLFQVDYLKLNGISMKKILITGSNGYVARNIRKKLLHYDLTFTNRTNLNLLDYEIVKNFFKHNYFDAVVHTATSGGSRLEKDNSNVFFENCIMHQNILDNSSSFDKYISNKLFIGIVICNNEICGLFKVLVDLLNIV